MDLSKLSVNTPFQMTVLVLDRFREKSPTLQRSKSKKRINSTEQKEKNPYA